MSPDDGCNKKRKEREVRTLEKIVSSQKTKVIVKDLHVTHEVITKHQFCKISRNEKRLKSIVRNLQQNPYQGTEEGD